MKNINNSILENYLDKDQLSSVDKVFLTFSDNHFLKILFKNKKPAFRKYYFNIKLSNNNKLKIQIDYNQKEYYKNEIYKINFTLQYNKNSEIHKLKSYFSTKNSFSPA